MANDTLSSQNSTGYICHGISSTDNDLYEEIHWWISNVFYIMVGLIGFVGNCLSIPVLCSKKLSSIFNRILVFLAIFDNVFILCRLLPVFQGFKFYVYIYVFFSYPLSAVSILCSISTTVILALERHLAISKPTEYHMATQGLNPWKRVMTYIIPVILFSTVFNIPKFFEVELIYANSTEVWQNVTDNATFNKNVWEVSYDATEIRMNYYYILFYGNIAKILVTGIIPFVALCMFNLSIYLALRSRHSTFTSSANSQQVNDDNRNSILLFGIVFIFLSTNVLRIIISIYELININYFNEGFSHRCNLVPFPAMVLMDVSELLLLINSSINFFLYCFMSNGFRDVLCETLNKSVYRPICERCFKIDRRRMSIKSDPSPSTNGIRLKSIRKTSVKINSKPCSNHRNGTDTSDTGICNNNSAVSSTASSHTAPSDEFTPMIGNSVTCTVDP